MSSLLVLQTNETVVFASDTAISMNNEDRYLRVGNESKLYDYPKFIMFTSGKMWLKDLFISKLSNNPNIEEIKELLDVHIKDLAEEFSLEIVIALKDLSKIVFFSSTNGFKYSESFSSDNTNLFTAGHKTTDVANLFIDNYNKYPLYTSLENTYKTVSSEEIGGYLDIFILNNELSKKRILIDEIECVDEYEAYKTLNLVHAERLVGKIILGNKLWIEDDAGVVEIKSALMTVYDQSGSPRVYLGRYPSPDNSSQFKYGLRVTNGAFDIRTSNSTNSGIQIDGNGLRAFNNNSVKTFEVNAATGQVSIIGGISIKTSPDSFKGVELDGNGLRIYGNSGQLVFSADNFGNVFYAGRLQNATGSVSNLDGTFVGDLVAAGGTFTGTLNGVDGVFTGNLSAVGGTFTGALSAASGTFQGVVTGSLSANTMKAINIDAKQITTGGLTAERINVQQLSAISSDLGNITAGTITGTQINTLDDLYVGDRIYFQGWGAKRILFDSMNFIGDDGTGSVEIQSFGDINLVTGATIRFMGKVDFSGAQVSGLPK